MTKDQRYPTCKRGLQVRDGTKAKDQSDLACALMVSAIERAVEDAMRAGASKSAIKRTVSSTMKRITETAA